MKRKVVKHGISTLTISLPSKWAKVNKIKNGDLLNLDLSKDKIVLSGKGKHFEEIELTLTGEEEWYIHRILRHLYTCGYDEIKVNYSKENQIGLIRKGIKYLTGIEVVESDSNSCLLKCVISADESDYHQIINRILWLIQSQFNYFIEDSKKGKLSMANEVAEIHKTMMKLNNLSRRKINKTPIYDSTISKYVYWFLTSLMNISSFILYCYEDAEKKSKINLTEKEFDLVNTTSEFYYNLSQAYKNMDLEKTRKFFEDREALIMDFLSLLKGENPIIVHYFLDILKEMSSIGNLIISLKTNEKK
jgi:phosphate uptake regulator